MATLLQNPAQTSSTPIRFSTTHGQNVQLQQDDQRAFWLMRKHVGNCVTNRPLSKGEQFDFRLSGSGHILLGLVSAKPDPAAIQDVEAINIEHRAHWTHFRFRKETANVSLNRVKAREVIFSRGAGRKQEKKTIDIQNKDLFVFFEVQFGDLTIQINNDEAKKPVSFDANCGLNVKLSHNQSQASLRNINPAALCATDRALADGEVINLQIEAVDGAKWTQAKLFVSNKSGSELKIHQLETSFRQTRRLFPTEGIPVDKKGLVQLKLTDAGEISYTVETEQKKIPIESQHIDVTKPLYLFVELFRVKIDLSSVLPETPEDVYCRTTDLTYLTAVPDTCQDDNYLNPTPEHPYDVINDRPNSAEQKSVVSAMKNVSPPEPEPEPDYLQVIGDQRNDVKETRPKKLWPIEENSITDVKQKVAEPKALPKREVPRNPSPNRRTDSDAEASGPTPGQHHGGPSGPGCRYPVSPTSPLAMPLLLPVLPIENHPFRVQMPEINPGLPFPSGDSLDGTSGEVQDAFSLRIRKNFTELMLRLDPEPIADHLFQEFGMSQHEHRSFLEKDEGSRRRQVLTILMQRPSTKMIFIKALKISAQRDILQLLDLEN